MILRHLAVCFGVEIDGINIDILKVLVWGAASPVSIGIYCDWFGSVSIGSIDGIFSSILTCPCGEGCYLALSGAIWRYLALSDYLVISNFIW